MQCYVSYSDRFFLGTKRLPYIFNNSIGTKNGIEFIGCNVFDESSYTSLKDCNIVFADLSLRSIKVGIELGWADSLNKEIVILLKESIELPTYLRYIKNVTVITYTSRLNLIEKMTNYFKKRGY